MKTTDEYGEELTVGEVKELARQWVIDHYEDDESCWGGYLVGSTNDMTDEQVFPLYRDVDIAIVKDNIEQEKIHEVQHAGLIFEYIICDSRNYHSPEKALSLTQVACNLYPESILVDFNNKLYPLHERIIREYANRKWVIARVNSEKRSAARALEGLKQNKGGVEFLYNLGRVVLYSTGMVTLAHLGQPTHRRGLVNLKSMLENDGHEKLFDKFLQACGSQHLDREDIESFLDDCLEAFDKAVTLPEGSSEYGYKIKPYIRPYLESGTRDIIEEEPRAAVFWIARFYVPAVIAIQQMGNDDDKKKYSEKLSRFLNQLGIASEDQIKARIEAAQHLYDEAYRYATNYIDLTCNDD